MKISVSLLLLRIQEVFEERGAQENAGEARRDRGVSAGGFLARALWRIVGWFYV
jgi:hypothetical protein